MKISWWATRNCWKKSITVNGKQRWKYYKFPNTQKGKEQAIQAYLRDKLELTGEKERQKLFVFARAEIQKVQRYLEEYDSKNSLIEALTDLLPDMDVDPDLAKMIELTRAPDIDGSFASIDEFSFYSNAEKELAKIIGLDWMTHNWTLPAVWQERVKIFDVAGESQLIGYWIERYKDHAKREGKLKAGSIYSKINHIRKFEKFIDTKQTVKHIDNQTVQDFEDFLNSQALGRASKKTYFAAFQQFCIFCRIESGCDFIKPSRLEAREIRFRTLGTGRTRIEKKELLWSPQEYQSALKCLPVEKQIWILLALNCGFRNTDLASLRWSDLNGNRLIHQRDKLNQLDNAPLINFKIWNRTLQLIDELPKKSELVLTDSKGKPLINNFAKVKGVTRPFDKIADWWQGNKNNYNLKRMDYLRKSGATFIYSVDQGLRRIYLGETLSGVEEINYTFVDGEINRKLDNATDKMEKHFFK